MEEKPVKKRKNELVPVIDNDSYVELLRKEHNELIDYPHTTTIFNRDVIVNIPKKFEGHIEYGCYEYNKEYNENDSSSYKLTHKNHILIAKRFPHEGDYLLFIFYKDFSIFEKELQKIEVYFPVDTYSLKSGYKYNMLKYSITDEESPILNDNIEHDIKRDIKRFFEKKDFYIKNKISFKRGILLYGPPGNGKTALIRTILKDNPDCYGIIITSENFDSGVSKYLKDVVDNKKKILIFEDIEDFEQHTRSTLLNFLDGVGSLENTFVIATTNGIDKVGEALKNRPSRFDKVYQITLPNKISRRKLLEKFFSKLDEKELKECVDLTDGFSGAYFKELFIFAELHNCTIKDGIDKINEQVRLYKEYGDKTYLG